jgi:large subunit ribosomal protein L30
MKKENKGLLAVVRVRGIRNMKPKIKHTLELLMLNKPNHCILVQSSPQMNGMLEIVKDYVAFGGVSENTVYKMLFKRGVKEGKCLSDTRKEDEIKGIAKEILGGKKVKEFANPVFRLRPPRKGYGSIKDPFPRGELGKRDEMDSLVTRMV